MRTLYHSTLRNAGTSFCTLHVSSTRVRRSVLHWVQEEDLAPSAPQALHHSPSARIGSCAPPAPPGSSGSSGSGFSGLTGSDPAGTPPRTQKGHRISLVSSRFHVDVVHVVFLLRNCTTVVLRISHLLLDPCIDFLRNIRTSVDQVTFVAIQDYNSTHCRVHTNRQQWLTHLRLNTSNSEIDSPIVATFNVQSLPRLDKLSSCCAESEVSMARKLLPVYDTLGSRCLSCACVNSNLNPLKLSLLKCVNVEKTHVELIKLLVAVLILVQDLFLAHLYILRKVVSQPCSTLLSRYTDGIPPDSPGELRLPCLSDPSPAPCATSQTLR